MSLAIPDFQKAQILVVGDLMLDRYWQGSTSRISPEAPVPVVNVNSDQLDARAGGAGNVAINIAALGARVALDGLAGDDESGQIMSEQLQIGRASCRERV